MLSNAYFLAKFRFDTAENEPAKNLQNFRKMHFRKIHFSKMHFSKMHFSKMHISKMHFSKMLFFFQVRRAGLRPGGGVRLGRVPGGALLAQPRRAGPRPGGRVPGRVAVRALLYIYSKSKLDRSFLTSMFSDFFLTVGNPCSEKFIFFRCEISGSMRNY